MAKQTINIGADPNDGTGDRPRVAGEKINDNFTELYSWARERVSSNRTYYVATTGSDSNTGLSVGVPFLTIQKALEVITDTLTIDEGVTVTVQLATGTYTLASAVTLPPFLGAGAVVVSGDTATPGNVIITSSALSVQFQALFQYDYTVQGMRFQASGGTPIALFANGGYIKFGNVEFNTGLLAHVYATLNGKAIATANYSIIGGANYHYVGDKHGVVDIVSRTVTVTGTPAFSGAFALAQHLGIIRSVSSTYSGSATGQRYFAQMNGVINVEGGGTSVFPGSIAGSTATGGQYA